MLGAAMVASTATRVTVIINSIIVKPCWALPIVLTNSVRVGALMAAKLTVEAYANLTLIEYAVNCDGGRAIGQCEERLQRWTAQHPIGKLHVHLGSLTRLPALKCQ